MTTTTLSTDVSAYAVGRQHGHFDVRGSTPTTGAMTDRDALGYWRVADSGGSFVRRTDGTVDFGWLGEDGDTVYGKAVDRAGNAGDWESYDFTVAANTAADVVYYVDNTNTSGTGTEGDPFETVAEARSAMNTNLGDGEVGVIFIKEGQTHTLTAAAWSGGDSLARCVRFVRWGTASTKPIMRWSAGTGAFVAYRTESIHVEDITIEGAVGSYAGTEAFAVAVTRSGGASGDREPFNLMFVDCDFRYWATGVYIDEFTLTQSDRDSGVFDFVAVQGCTFTDLDGPNSVYCMLGWKWARYWLIRDITIGDTATDTQIVRLYYLGEGLADGITDTDDVELGRFRIICGPATDADGGWRRNTWMNVNRTNDGEPFGGGDLSIECDAGVAGVGYMTDTRFLNFMTTSGLVETKVNDAANNGVECERVDFINVICRGFQFNTSSEAGNVHQSIRLRNCAVVRHYQDGGFMQMTSAESAYADGCFEVHGCVVYWPMTDNFDGNGVFINAPNMTRSDLAAKFTACDYNHAGKVDADAIDWAYHSDSPFVSNLSAWQSATSLDGNSVVSNSTTYSFTDDGETASSGMDLTLTNDTGPLSGAGYPLPSGVGLDFNGYLRDASTPDAGPFEYGASTQPDDPSLGANAEGSATLPMLTATGSATTIAVATGSATLSMLTASGSGAVISPINTSDIDDWLDWQIARFGRF